MLKIQIHLELQGMVIHLVKMLHNLMIKAIMTINHFRSFDAVWMPQLCPPGRQNTIWTTSVQWTSSAEARSLAAGWIPEIWHTPSAMQ